VPNVAAGNPIQQGPIGALTSRSSAIRLLRNRRRNLPLGPGKLTVAIGVAREVPEQAMTILKWALIFFLVSIVAGILGFTGISEASADIARFLFYVFVMIFLVLLILGLTIFRA
jgi:uncharacterized membrane protein YtjA (UPF0391 family)